METFDIPLAKFQICAYEQGLYQKNKYHIVLSACLSVVLKSLENDRARGFKFPQMQVVHFTLYSSIFPSASLLVAQALCFQSC